MFGNFFSFVMVTYGKYQRANCILSADGWDAIGEDEKNGMIMDRDWDSYFNDGRLENEKCRIRTLKRPQMKGKAIITSTG